MPKICKIENCEKPSRRYGMCVMHSSRFERYGDPNVTKHRANGTAMQYLREVVLPYQGTDCLLWPYNRCKGYAQISTGKRTHAYVSRLICEEFYGPAPSATHQAAHSCGKGLLGCVNPLHLRWASPIENHADMHEHGTRSRGEKHYLAKLTEADVRAIRTLKGTMSPRQIGLQFGVTDGAIRAIFRGYSWAWVD